MLLTLEERRQGFTQVTGLSGQVQLHIRIERLIEFAKVKYVDVKRTDALELVDLLQSGIDVPTAPGNSWDFNHTTQWIEMRETMNSGDG